MPSKSSRRPDVRRISLEPSEGFPAIEGTDARLLVLGSLPGQRSLAERQYYAHPRNAFWRIMKDVLGVTGSYEQRCKQLVAQRVALWDVLASSVRPGSLDADIKLDSARANDFTAFFTRHPELHTIAFNGKRAEQLFTRFVGVDTVSEPIQLISLPSTSPAYAALPFAAKLAAWRSAITTATQKME